MMCFFYSFELKAKVFMKIYLSAFFLLLILSVSYAQEDSVKATQDLQKTNRSNAEIRKEIKRQKFLKSLPENHNPKTATLLSLIPGAGQIYNRRYWKLPIVYGGLAAFGYFTLSSYLDYRCYRRAYIELVDTDPNTNYACSIASNANVNDLYVLRNTAQEQSELFLLGTILFYGLTIVDAFVDAHLMKFDVSDDLSMRIRPNVNYDFTSNKIMPLVQFSFVLKNVDEPQKLF